MTERWIRRLGAVGWSLAALNEVAISLGWFTSFFLSPHWFLAMAFALLALSPWMWREE